MRLLAMSKHGLSGMLVPRGAPGLRFAQPISKIGHRLCQNNEIIFENCRVPEENVFAEGNGDLIVAKDFTRWKAEWNKSRAEHRFC